MIIDSHAHAVPGRLIEVLRAERRIFPSVRLLAEDGTTRMAFAGEAARLFDTNCNCADKTEVEDNV
jgi:hypothetical protein